MESIKSKKKIREKYSFYVPPPARKLVCQEEAVAKESDEKKRGNRKKKLPSDREEIVKEKSENDSANVSSGNDKVFSVQNCDNGTKSEGSHTSINKLKSVPKNNSCASKNKDNHALLDHSIDNLRGDFFDKLRLVESKTDSNHNKCKEHDRNLSNIDDITKDIRLFETNGIFSSSEECVNNSQCSSSDNQTFRNIWDTLLCDHQSSVASPDTTQHTSKTQAKINNTSSRRKDFNGFKELDENCIIEIYGFPEEFKTSDLLTIFSPYINRGFQMRWVDDTHALGIFISHLTAYEVLNTDLPSVQTRALHQATTPSKEKAKQLMPPPPPPRPKTCSALARRLVSGALGIRAVFTPAEIQAEKEMLQVAREERTLAAKLRESS